MTIACRVEGVLRRKKIDKMTLKKSKNITSRLKSGNLITTTIYNKQRQPYGSNNLCRSIQQQTIVISQTRPHCIANHCCCKTVFFRFMRWVAVAPIRHHLRPHAAAHILSTNASPIASAPSSIIAIQMTGIITHQGRHGYLLWCGGCHCCIFYGTLIM